MGKVDRLRNKVEPFAALFWALGIDPARWPGITPSPYTKHVLIWSCCLYGMWRVGSILIDNVLSLSPRFSYLGMLFIYGSVQCQCTMKCIRLVYTL